MLGAANGDARSLPSRRLCLARSKPSPSANPHFNESFIRRTVASSKMTKRRANLMTAAFLALLCISIVAESTSDWERNHRNVFDPKFECFHIGNLSVFFAKPGEPPPGVFLFSSYKIRVSTWLSYLKLFFAFLAMCSTVGFLIYAIRTYIYFMLVNSKKRKTLETFVFKSNKTIDQESWRWTKVKKRAEVEKNEAKRVETFKATRKELRKRKLEFWKSMDVKTKINDGATFSNYVVKRKIAEGGFGKVYEVQDVNGNLYAMKVEPLTTLVYGIKQDLEVLYALRDTGGDIRFCKVFDSGVKHDLKYMVMTILGPPLQNFFIRHKKEHFPLGCVVDLAKQTLESVEALHNAGYVHRDLKAENWVLGNVNSDIHEQRKVYLIDFGAVYKFLCPSCERKRGRQQKTHTASYEIRSLGSSLRKTHNSSFEVKPLIITYDDYFEKYFGEGGKRIPDKLPDHLIKVDDDTFEDFGLFFNADLHRIPQVYVREVTHTFLKEKKIDEQFAKLKEALTPSQLKHVTSSLPHLPNGRFFSREVLREPQMSGLKLKLLQFFNSEGQVLPELVKVENVEIDAALPKFAAFFDLNEKLNKRQLYNRVDLETALRFCDAEDLVRARVKKCERILKRNRCGHFSEQHGDDALPYVKPSRNELAVSPYTMYYCALARSFVKPYGRKDDLESWLFSIVDWTSTVPWKRIDDDIGMTKMKLASRWDSARRDFFDRCPPEFEEILIYIDSLDFHEKPDYTYIYDVLEKIIRVNKLKYLPLTTIDHKEALPRQHYASTTGSDKPKPRDAGITQKAT